MSTSPLPRNEQEGKVIGIHSVEKESSLWSETKNKKMKEVHVEEAPEENDICVDENGVVWRWTEPASDSEKETYDRMLREVLDDDYVDPTRDVAHQTKLAQQFRAKFTGAPPSESSANYGGAK